MIKGHCPNVVMLAYQTVIVLLLFMDLVRKRLIVGYSGAWNLVDLRILFRLYL